MARDANGDGAAVVTKLDPEVRDYYECRPEETRLERGLCQIEAARTRDLLRRLAPPAPAIVIDVGGAAGAYALWLAGRHYTVHLLDPVPRLVEAAALRSSSSESPLASCHVGDARLLPFSSGFADMVLLLGPLYHLTEHDDRIQALLEARRVLKPGGTLVVAAITRWAAALDQLLFDTVSDAEFTRRVTASARDGQYRSPRREPSKFTTAYFHRPDELVQELREAGYVNDRVFGVEGPARMLRDFDRWWDDPVRRGHLMRLAEAFETEPWLLGMSPHLLAFAQSPVR